MLQKEEEEKKWQKIGDAELTARQAGRHRNGYSALKLFISLFSFPLRKQPSLSQSLSPIPLHVINHHICSLLEKIPRIFGCGGLAVETMLHKQRIPLLLLLLHWQLLTSLIPSVCVCFSVV